MQLVFDVKKCLCENGGNDLLQIIIFCGSRESYFHFCGRKLLSFSWHFSSIVVLWMTCSLSSFLFKQYSCFFSLTTFNTYSCSFSLVFYTSNKNAHLAHAERQSVLSVWVTVLPLNWSGKYLHFIKYICCWVLLLWIPCPLQGPPEKEALFSEMGGRGLLQRVGERGKGEPSETQRALLAHGLNTKAGFAHLFPVSTGFSHQSLCGMQQLGFAPGGVCTTPQRHA